MLLHHPQHYDPAPTFASGFRKLKNFGMILFTALALSHSSTAFSQSLSAVNEPPSFENTAGTFQFASPTGKMFFWRMDFIESLYPEIESRRALDHNTIWHYSDDMDIIIFSTNTVLASDFVPLDSPYNGLKDY